MCAVPRAAINIITSTQQRQIATTGFAASICAREDSMCAAVLDHTDRVVVPDASLDARFRENPFVTGDPRHRPLLRLRAPDHAGRRHHRPSVRLRLAAAGARSRPRRRRSSTIAERVVDVLELRLRTRELEDSLAALTQTRDELHRSNEALSVFAGQVSHDLRTPLTAIMASTEMLGQQPAVAGDDWSERLVATAYRSATRMAGMIEQILAHARVGAELHRTDTDLDVVLASVLEDLAPTLEARSASVMTGELPTLPADGQQLYSVLLNLVSNAVKYARPGVPPVIEVSAERSGESWRLSVRDNGIGISAGDRDLVFGLFNRVETSVDGSGIGLATVKRIIEAHGGTIGISSVEGPGTDVWFELPAAARGPDEPDGTSDGPTGRRARVRATIATTTATSARGS